MKVFFHEDFYQVYTLDPAAEQGRMEAIVEAIEPEVDFVTAEPASQADISAVHTEDHIASVRRKGLYSIAALAAGGALQAALQGLSEPCFALIRPPGHHASAGSSWGFCFFNNMVIALEALKRRKKIGTAFVLDIDLHFGDGTVNICQDKDYVAIFNGASNNREVYLEEISQQMENCRADIIGISAGFDNHEKDWGGLLRTEDYFKIGQMVQKAALRCEGGCFGVLEGGYNHEVLGQNVLALIHGLSDR